MSRFSKAIAKSPISIYSTALPLTLSSNRVSGQYLELFKNHIKLRQPSIDYDIDKKWFGPDPISSGKISGSAVSSTDMRYLICRSDTFVHIKNVNTGEEIRQLRGHTCHVLSIAISLDGRIIASGSLDGKIRLWDTETGAPIGETLAAHAGGVSHIAFSPSGNNIASGSHDCMIRVWSVETAQLISTPFAKGNYEVHCVTYSPDGNKLASDSDNGGIMIWDVGRGMPTNSVGGRSTIRSLAFSPNGLWLAFGSDAEVRVWNVLKGERDGEPLRAHTQPVRAVKFSPDGRRLISGSNDGTVRIWSLETREEVMPPLQQTSMVWTIAYSEDGSRIFSASDCDYTIWNSLTGKPVISSLETIAMDGPNLKLNDFQFFEDWAFENGWLRGASGEYRLFLSGYMHKLVRQVKKGLYIYHELHLNLCVATETDHKGFTLPS